MTEQTAWLAPKSEAELCDRFAALAREDGWIVYPETSGWDLLLVATKETRDFDHDSVGWFTAPVGTQVGIEAKRRANFIVLEQALKSASWSEQTEGPDFRAVLVPESINGFNAVARQCGLGVFDLRELESMTDYRPRRRYHVTVAGMKPWPYQTRCWLPDFVPDLPAGVPAPRQMTRWKAAALKICETLRERGYVTSADFRLNGISPSTWVDRWIVWSGERISVGSGPLLHKYIGKPFVILPDGRFYTPADSVVSEQRELPEVQRG